MARGFDWHRWHRFHRAASKRYSRHLARGVPVKEAWRRYDMAMDYCRKFLETLSTEWTT